MISAFEVAEFVSDEQAWRELADTKKFPLPPELEPECELDTAVRSNPHVREPTLILVEFDQIVGQNILLTYPTLSTAAVSHLNDALQVVFGVNYQEVAMSQFCIVPESTSVFPDIEYPTYARYFTVYDADGRGLVRNCCICFLASTAHQLYKYLECMEAGLSCLLSGLTDANLCLFWVSLHSRLRSLEYTREQAIRFRESAVGAPATATLSPEDARTLGMTDRESVDSGIAGVHGAIRVVRDFATDCRGLSLAEGAALESAEVPPSLVKLMSIHASDSKREMKPVWQLLGQERDSLTGLMADVVKEAVKSSEDDAWAWCLPSLLGELLQQQLHASPSAVATPDPRSGGRRGSWGRSRGCSMASSTVGGGGGAPSVDSFKSLASLRSYREDGHGCAAVEEEFHSVGSSACVSNASSMERICAVRDCSWTITNGCGGDDLGCSSLPIHASLAQVPPVFPNVRSADQEPVIRFLSAHARYPYGVAHAVAGLLQGRRVALICRTESEARLLQRALALFVPFADSPAWSGGPWFQKLPVLSALASVPVACVARSANGQLPASAPLRRFLCCLDVAGRQYSGPVYQGGALVPLLGPDVGQCMLRSHEFAERLIDLIQTDLAQLTLTVMSLHLSKYQSLRQQPNGSTNAFDSQRQLTAELARLGVTQDDYLIGMHLSKLILGKVCGAPPLSISLS